MKRTPREISSQREGRDTKVPPCVTVMVLMTRVVSHVNHGHAYNIAFRKNVLTERTGISYLKYSSKKMEETRDDRMETTPASRDLHVKGLV
ncbi:hypothetical protein Tco_1121856 [Tanacetum coccineum]|uniref:Uncharacterized protein n=1 Tax=Tanacetum coccineum TaxID=301880 RepID=A0ABQ5IYW6_9ASTR